MRSFLSFSLLFVLLTFSPVLKAQEHYELPSNPELKVFENEDALNFLVLGDWGRNGEFFQKPVARELAKASKTLDTEFIISVGDNFYPVGVQSTLDPQWRQSFEDIYFQFDLNKPWYSVLGNHDYYGSIDAQIEYSSISRRWNMPAPYFKETFDLPEGDGKVLFLFIDTVPFIQKYRNRSGMMQDNLKKQDTTAQLNWLKSELKNKAKDVKWVFVVGHHPLYSGGKRKVAEETEDMRKIFEPIFQQYKVDAYLTGHEHDLQVIQPKGIHTVQFLSGAGSEIRPSGEREGTLYAVSDGGFLSFSLLSREMTVVAVNGDGKVLYLRSFKK